MPQVDLETLVSVCGSHDRKIACESLADRHISSQTQHISPENVPDVPPDSFWLSKDAELDWFDRNALYERKESTKGSNSTNLNPNLNSSGSQRYAVNLKSKASIIGLPKPTKACLADAKLRRNCKPPNVKLFPKRSSKSSTSVNEPSSPKVSCMGRVRSNKDRNRRAKKLVAERAKQNRKAGIWSSLTEIFRSGRPQKPSVPVILARNESPERNQSPVTVEPPGLGGVKRFTSCRRPVSWGIKSELGEEPEFSNCDDQGRSSGNVGPTKV